MPNTSSQPCLAWLRLIWPLAVLAVGVDSYAQEAEQSDAATLAEGVAAMEAEIAAHRRDIAQLQNRVEGREGLGRTIFETRLDEAQLALFDTTIRLATEIAETRDRGLDVSDFVDDVTEILGELPAAAIDAALHIRDRITIVAEPSSPGDAILVDQELALEVAELDEIFTSLLAYLEIAPRFDIDTTEVRTRLSDLLTDSAANRSVFLEIANREAAKLRKAVATLANDQELQTWLSAMEARAIVASEALESAVGLMNRLGLETESYRRQLIAATGEITTDVLEVGFLANLIGEWTASAMDIAASQGPRLLFSAVLALLLLFVFLQFGRVVQKVVASALRNERVHVSSLLERMILSTVRNLVILIGILVALSQLGISLGPLLAGLGIAGFVIGFALQDSLSNFASGMMILFYRPFDVGDFVEVAGVKGRVENMSMVNTTFLTIDNQKLVVPNNMIWQSVIANYTDQATRRVDLVFGISYSDDIDEAEAVVGEVLKGYDRILEEPAPVVKVGELGDSSVNLIVRPWVRTEDYWDTYWDLTKQIKQAFDREGITIPFPQRDLHVIREGGSSEAGTEA